MDSKDISWSAIDFFSSLAAKNKLARKLGFVFCKVSSLDGFEEALANMQDARALICVSDTSDGFMSLINAPRTRRIKPVFLAMRHAIDDMDAREQCMNLMRELFRQFMSVLIKERTRLENHCVFIDEKITFSEIPKYFFSGCACAFFQITTDTFTDLRYDPSEWTE